MILSNHFKNIAFFMLLSCMAFAQEEKSSTEDDASKYDKRLVKAEKEFNSYAFVDAREMYLDIEEKGYTSAELYKKLGDSYYFNAALEDALPWYEKLVNTYPNETGPEYLFRYSQSLKSVKRYQEADRAMEKYSAIISNDKRAALFTSTKDYLDFIEMQSGKFQIDTVSLNSEYSDYAPSYNYKGQLVFASSRLGNTASKNIHQWNEMPFLDVFSSETNPATTDEDENIPKKLKGRINTRFHESSTAFSKDGNTVYFTRNNYTGGKLRTNTSGTILLKLYRATRNNDRWENVEELPFNNDEYSVAHPALSSDGKKLYFASDMPGTKGLSDIYVVDIYEDGSFGTPTNLGDHINTEGRETFPYIGASGNLYFASDGHIGLGGLDVFVAVQEDGNFSKPYNVGKPINSPEDDFTFIIDEATKTGYFASNRSGGLGSDDIYRFTQTSDLITSCNQYLSGTVTDLETNAALSGAEIILVDANDKELARTVTDAQGNYTFNINCETSYTVRGSKPKYKPNTADLTTNTTFEKKYQLPLQLEEELVLEEGVDLAKLLNVIIYFDSGKAFIRPEAEIELQKIIKVLNDYPELKIDIRSHTDSRSSARYNLGLSDRRAKSTIKYIVEEGGIDPSRISGRGYGESQLLNKCKNRVRCSEEEHQLNRRSEFIVVK